MDDAHGPADHAARSASYTFEVVVEPDEDLWHAYAPALEDHGAVTWGETREEALRHIGEVVRLVVESMVEHGEPIPTPSDQARGPRQPVVAVTV